VNRQQLEHILRAAAGNADALDFVVVGSQAILGEFPDAPPELCISMEADLYPRDRPEDAVLIDGGIGEQSMFHQTFGYYGHGVGEDTAILPAGWHDRLVRLHNENTRGATGWCLEVHDLAISKLVAGREKDISYLEALFRHRLAKPAVVRERLAVTGLPSPEQRDLCLARLGRILAGPGAGAS
jgi:hypothetical protein